MLNILNFFTDSGSLLQNGGWVSIVLIAVMFVALILMLVIPNRRQKKQAEEMMAKLTVGAIVTTIGGIIGEVVQLDDKYIWLATGTDDNKTVMQFVRQAIHSVSAAPDSPEGKAEAEAERKEGNEEDEIK